MRVYVRAAPAVFRSQNRSPGSALDANRRSARFGTFPAPGERGGASDSDTLLPEMMIALPSSPATVRRSAVRASTPLLGPVDLFGQLGEPCDAPRTARRRGSRRRTASRCKLGVGLGQRQHRRVARGDGLHLGVAEAPGRPRPRPAGPPTSPVITWVMNRAFVSSACHM